MAEDGKLGHYSEGNVLYVLLEAFADAVEIMSIVLCLDMKKAGSRQMQDMRMLYPPKHIQGIVVPQTRLKSPEMSRGCHTGDEGSTPQRLASSIPVAIGN